MPRLYINAKVDARRGTEEFKAARRDLSARLKSGLVSAGEKAVLPHARSIAPRKTGRLASSLVIKATTRNAFLTTSLPRRQGRYVGWLEFGGTVRRIIKPRRAKALYFDGRFVSAVRAPRKIEGRGFLSRAVQDRLRQVEAIVGDEILRAFDGFEATR